MHFTKRAVVISKKDNQYREWSKSYHHFEAIRVGASVAELIEEGLPRELIRGAYLMGRIQLDGPKPKAKYRHKLPIESKAVREHGLDMSMAPTPFAKSLERATRRQGDGTT